MFGIFGSDKHAYQARSHSPSQDPQRNHYTRSPVYDLKQFFKFGSTSSSPSSECAYTALPTSRPVAVDIPLSDISSQRRQSSCSLDDVDGTTSPPPRYRPPSYYATLFGGSQRTSSRNPSRACFLGTLAALVSLFVYMACYVAFRPPNYIVLPPEKYVDVLNTTLYQLIPKQSAREAVSRHLEQIRLPSPTLRSGLDPAVAATAAAAAAADPSDTSFHGLHSVVPTTIWGSDAKPPPGAWATKWIQMGFDPKFLDDAGAEAWVMDNFNGTQIKKVWDDLPRFILKADLLRYLLLLVEGGTWSDMDTLPLMHRNDWAKDTVPLASVRPPSSGILGRRAGQARSPSPSEATSAVDATGEPVRAIIGIECDWNENPSIRNFFERWRILPMNRHRPLQFVQWTMHAAPNHPILLDVVRRIAQSTDVYRAYEIEQQRESYTDGWGWGEKATSYKQEQAKMREAHMENPWEAFSMSWKWQAGHWRLGWDTLSVEEWTGPAVYTDAIISYLYAAAGIRPEDLSLLRSPVQVRDIVIVPSYGFNPGSSPMKNSRLIHLFRGSWKG
ncbi:hypothetical protein BCV70DRAFT_112902 [Testicularia cyperi]|uniref:Alpha-1,6-mannosyltransferase n=1 Tax=Testicularia cyperi TaxID=1882483 RepID=A0A317XN97_9BASI|nr:hypothetical protein BCV70DRAFT_112902 [Testicularia cyperi]